MIKILFRFQKLSKKIENKAFRFLDKSILIGCSKFLVLRKEYLSTAFKVLTDIERTFFVTV